MKKILALMAVTVIAANLTGCCCQRLCPICPCNWFNRGAACATPTYAAAPLVAQPCCPPSPCAPAVIPQIMPQQTFAAAPLAAVTPNQACCATWDPCRGTTITCPQPPCAPPCPPAPCAQVVAPCCPCPPVECCYPCDPCCCPTDCPCGDGCSGTSSYGGEGCGCGGSHEGMMMGAPVTGGSTDPVPMAE